MKEYIKFNGKISGVIDYDKKAFISVIDRSHVFIKYRGIGVSDKVLQCLESKGINTIIKVLEGHELVASVNMFYFKGIEYDDYSSGKLDKQWILPIEFFNKSEEKLIQSVL